MRKLKVNGSYKPYISSGVTWTTTYRRDFKVASPAVLGDTYSITINGTTTSIVAASTNAASVANQITNAFATPAGWKGNCQNDTVGSGSVYVIVTSPTSFTYSSTSNITSQSVNVFYGDLLYENRVLNYAQLIQATGVQFYDLRGVYQTNLESFLPNFIDKCYSTYNMTRVACIHASTSDFNKALAYNASQSVSNKQWNEFNVENEFWFGLHYDFTINSVVVGFTYSITIIPAGRQPNPPYTLKTYTTVGITGDTTATIAQRLVAQMVANPNGPNYVYQIDSNSANKINVFNRANLEPYNVTYSSNISAEKINSSFAEYNAIITALKQGIGSNPWKLTVYIANPFNLWGNSQAVALVGGSNRIDEFECTNYKINSVLPRATAFIQYQLTYLAYAGNVWNRSIHVYVLFSAESIYNGSYFTAGAVGSPNTIEAPPSTAAETVFYNTATTGFTALTFANKNRIIIDGFDYFDYANMTANNVQL